MKNVVKLFACLGVAAFVAMPVMATESLPGADDAVAQGNEPLSQDLDNANPALDPATRGGGGDWHRGGGHMGGGHMGGGHMGGGHEGDHHGGWDGGHHGGEWHHGGHHHGGGWYGGGWYDGDDGYWGPGYPSYQYACFARNGRGQTFVGRSYDAGLAQRIALRACYSRGGYCRALGCR